MMRQVMPDATQEHLPEAAAPATAHDDEIRTFPPCGIEQDLCGVAGFE